MDSWVWAVGERRCPGSRGRPSADDKRSPLQLPQVDPHLCAVASLPHPNLGKTARRSAVMNNILQTAGKCFKTISALTTMWLEKVQRNIIGICFLALKEGQNYFSFSKRGSLL